MVGDDKIERYKNYMSSLYTTPLSDEDHILYKLYRYFNETDESAINERRLNDFPIHESNVIIEEIICLPDPSINDMEKVSSFREIYNNANIATNITDSLSIITEEPEIIMNCPSEVTVCSKEQLQGTYINNIKLIVFI